MTTPEDPKPFKFDVPEDYEQRIEDARAALEKLPRDEIGPAQSTRIAAAAAYEIALATLYAQVVADDAIANAAIRIALHLDWPQVRGSENFQEVERMLNLTHAALEAAGLPVWNRPGNRDRPSVSVEPDLADGCVYVQWMQPREDDFNRSVWGAQLEAGTARLQEVLRTSGFESAETDPDFNPYLLEILSYPDGAAAEAEAFQYFFKVNDADRDRRPRGVFRRCEVDGLMRDEVYNFRRDAWTPTDFFDLYRLGHDDWDPIETTAAEARAVIAAIRQRRAERAQ